VADGPRRREAAGRHGWGGRLFDLIQCAEPLSSSASRFFSQRTAIECQMLAILRYSARLSGVGAVLANCVHSAANSRNTVDGSRSPLVWLLLSFGIRSASALVKNTAYVIRTDLPCLVSSGQLIGHLGPRTLKRGHGLRNSASSLAILTAIRRASSLASGLAASFLFRVRVNGGIADSPESFPRN